MECSALWLMTLSFPERTRCFQADGSPCPEPHVRCLPSNRETKTCRCSPFSLSLSLISLSRHCWETADSTSLTQPPPHLSFLLIHPCFSFFFLSPSHFTPPHPSSRLSFQPHPRSPSLQISETTRSAHPSHSVWQEDVRLMTLLLPLSQLPRRKRFHAIPLAFSRENRQLVFVVRVYQSSLPTFRWEMIYTWRFSEGGKKMIKARLPFRVVKWLIFGHFWKSVVSCVFLLCVILSTPHHHQPGSLWWG